MKKHTFSKRVHRVLTLAFIALAVMSVFSLIVHFFSFSLIYLWLATIFGVGVYSNAKSVANGDVPDVALNTIHHNAHRRPTHSFDPNNTYLGFASISSRKFHLGF